MTGSLYYNFWEDWLLYHKVIFDGVAKLVYIAPTETSITIKDDVYSAWKEWIQVRENLKWAAAMRTVGGDPTIGGASLGATFFMINGWRILLDHGVTFTGNLFSDDYDSAYTTLPGVELALSQVSNLIDIVTPDLSALSVPTASENADAVRTELSPELTAIGTIPTDVRTELSTELSYLDTSVSSIPGAVLDETVAQHTSSGTAGEALGNLDYRVSTVSSELAVVDGVVDTISTKVTLIAAAQEVQRALLNENTVTDQHTYDSQDPPNLLSARIRAYDTRAHAEAAGSTGVLQTFIMTATYDSNGKLLTYTYVRVGS